MPLTGNQFKQIHSAFLSAYDGSSLRQMVRFELGIELNQIAGGQNDSEIVYSLVVWAIQNGHLFDLINGALRQNPASLILQELAADVRAWDVSGTDIMQLQSPASNPRPTIQGDVGAFVGGNLDISAGAEFVGRDKIIVMESPKDEQAWRNRHAMLKLVNDTWVKGVLEKSIYNEVLIELKVERTDNTVVNPWDMHIYVPTQKNHQLPQETKIIDVFDAMNQSLLILGEPGAGKTTLLLELARDTIARAMKNDKLPIPVVFNLSSWGEMRLPLTEWIVDEFNSKYYIPIEVARRWMENAEVMLLLDGLDELKQEYRDECVTAINNFRRNNLIPLVVCSRTTEYQDLTERLILYGAVLVQPLTPTQVKDYFDRIGADYSSLSVILGQDSELKELVASPLMLSIMAMVLHGLSTQDLVASSTMRTRTQYVFDAYIERMFLHRGTTQSYPSSQTLYWLSWLAGKMQQHGTSVFLIERLQPSWFDFRLQRWIYLVMVGVLVGLPAGLLGHIVFGRHWAIPFGLVMGFIVGPVFRFMEYIGIATDTIVLVPKVKWSWSYAVRNMRTNLRWNLTISVTVGVFGFVTSVITTGGISSGTFFAVISILFVIIAQFLFFLLWDLLRGGLHEVEIEETVMPNQGIFQSARNSIIYGMFSGIVLGVAGILFGLLLQYQNYDGIIFGLELFVIGLVFFAFVYGLLAVFEHISLRTALLLCNSIPWNYSRFLDHCHDRLFLRKVGGGYIFIHRMLMEHFAELNDEDIKRIAGAGEGKSKLLE